MTTRNPYAVVAEMVGLYCGLMPVCVHESDSLTEAVRTAIDHARANNCNVRIEVWPGVTGQTTNYDSLLEVGPRDFSAKNRAIAA